jgi:hypothetical protein
MPQTNPFYSSAFTRTQSRFVCNGVQLTRAADNCDPGKFPQLQNIRPVVGGTIQARGGIIPVGGASFGTPIHTLRQFDDPTPFAENPRLYVIGAGGNLIVGGLNGPFPTVDRGYSGNPLSVVAATPPQSPQPWLYIADSARMRKIDANGHVYQLGLNPPLAAPSTSLGALGFLVIDAFPGSGMGGLQWQSAGGQVGSVSAINFSNPQRINTTISQILYDTGSAPGNASIAPASMVGFDDQIYLIASLAGTPDPIICQQVTVAVAPTTIQSILYDTGTTGLCTIQPVGSLGTGEVDTPLYAEVPSATQRTTQGATIVGSATYAGGGGEPSLSSTPPTPSPTAPHERQINFPVNSLITLGGASETVRILSVTVGPDGSQSFRCSTGNTHNPGDSITGVPGFRAYLQNTHSPGDVLNEPTFTNVITPDPTLATQAAGTITAVGGIQTISTWAPRNAAFINGQATLPDDDFHCSIRFSNINSVSAVRVYLDVDASVNDFTQNYYFFEWSANDLLTAIQAQNTDPTATLQAATQFALNQAQVNAAIASTNIPSAGQQFLIQVTDQILQGQLGVGSNVWIELRCKVSQFVRVGTDTSRTLATIQAAEIVVGITGSVAVTVDYDALWFSGGYAPDVGDVGNPYTYCSRYRSLKTGAVSNPSPATVGGIIARRQPVTLQQTASPDPQVDLDDYFRLGGALTRWAYVGSVPTGTPFQDIYSDSAVAGGAALDQDVFPPWPTEDLPRSGTCNVAGSAVEWVSGDVFNVNWAPGSLFIVNGQSYTLYAQPSSSTRLVLSQNAGTVTGGAFRVPDPTILGESYQAIWGGPIEGATFLFACGDPLNPGQVHWTTGNNSEAASDVNTLDVTAASEPLQNGYLYDGVPYVASTEQHYVLQPVFGSTPPFQPDVTPCGRGFWTPWAFALGPEGCFFLAKDGIYLTTGGSVAKSLTDADLYPLFPHDAQLGQAVNGYQPVDMSQTTRLRLAYLDGWLYFDYVDLQGTGRTLVCRVSDGAWFPDVLTPAIATRHAVQGASVYGALMGGSDGQLYLPSGFTDNGTPIPALIQLVDNQGDGRRQKIYRDFLIKGDLTGSTVTAVLGFTDNATPLAPLVFTGTGGLQSPIEDIFPTIGKFGTNLTATLTWSPTAIGLPNLQLWDLAFQLAPELASSWLSGPTTHGFRAYQSLYRFLVAYLSNGPVTFTVIIDGTLYRYSLPSSNGQYAKSQIVCQAVKGKTFQYGMQGSPFLLFDQDCEAWVSVWGQPGGYQQVRPF